MTERDSDLERQAAQQRSKPLAPTVARELLWLKRRRELLLRAIAEMEHNVAVPEIRLELVSNVPELLGWAKSELGRIEKRITQIGHQ